MPHHVASGLFVYTIEKICVCSLTDEAAALFGCKAESSNLSKVNAVDLAHEICRSMQARRFANRLRNAADCKSVPLWVAEFDSQGRHHFHFL